MFCQLRSILHLLCVPPMGWLPGTVMTLDLCSLLSFCWQHQQVRKWNKKEAGADGVLRTQTARPESLLFWQWQVGQLQLGASPAPATSLHHQAQAVTASCASSGASPFFCFCELSPHVCKDPPSSSGPELKPRVCHWFLARTTTDK